MLIDIDKIKQEFPTDFYPSNTWRKVNGLSDSIRLTGIECGEFIRVVTGWIGLDGKWESLSPVDNKKKLCIPLRVPQEGDSFIIDGGKYGHIGLVTGNVIQLPNKTFDFDTIEANAKSDGKVSYRRRNSSECFGFAPLGIKLKYQKQPPIKEEEKIMPTNIKLPPFYQYNYDVCVLASVIRVCNYHANTHFSLPQLFDELNDEFINRWSTGKVLDWVRDVGLIHDQYNPLQKNTENYLEVWSRQADKVRGKKRHKFNHSLIAGKFSEEVRDKMLNCLYEKKPLIANVDVRQVGWDEGEPYNLPKFQANHAIVITGVDEAGNWKIANHWEGRETGTVHKDYPFSWIYKITK